MRVCNAPLIPLMRDYFLFADDEKALKGDMFRDLWVCITFNHPIHKWDIFYIFYFAFWLRPMSEVFNIEIDAYLFTDVS